MITIGPVATAVANVNLASPTISTTQREKSAKVGASIADTATVSGGNNPTGTVTFRLYDNPDAAGPPTFVDTEPLASGSATSASYTTTAEGAYFWVATYNGDGNNNPVTAGHTDEPVGVGPELSAGYNVCKRSYTGTGQSVAIPRGATCTLLPGAHVTGAVTVAEGGTLIADFATIDQNVFIKGMATLCGSTIGLDVLATNPKGPVTIGGPSCAGNLIKRKLVIEGSSNDITVAGNTVTNLLKIRQNAGGAISVNGNTVTGGQFALGTFRVFYNVAPDVVNNTANYTKCGHNQEQTGYGNTASVINSCPGAPAIHIVKTADAGQVNAGQPIGFTLTVYNSGSGDATGVNLTDVLPVKTGLSWTIANQGIGWAGTCRKIAGTLRCGPVTVPAATTQTASEFTVHITSPTTTATGGACPSGSGKIDNADSVTTTNGSSEQSSASVCVAPLIHIVKTADAAQVNAGEQIGFTLTVYNTGPSAATGVNLSDVLPVKAGLSWTIASQGTGWAGTCGISAGGTLSCGSVTVPAGTTQAASTFKVHVTSPTTLPTGGGCPSGNGKIDNTADVTTANYGSDQSNPSTCVAALIHIAKTADAAQVNTGQAIGFTLTVYNTGPSDANGVNLSDVLPAKAGLSWTIASQGNGWAGTCGIDVGGTLNCGSVTVPAGTTQAASTFTVHVTSPTILATGGQCPAGLDPSLSGVIDNSADVSTTDFGSDQSSMSVCVAAPTIHIVNVAYEGQVNAGAQIGFLLVVFNTGTGDANGVTVSDPLPVRAGLSWAITAQGSGWAGTCAIADGTLTCGGVNGVTVPAKTTQAATTFTVHITSQTTSATGGVCPTRATDPGTGKITNTGNVDTTNGGSAQASATTCVAS